MDEIFRREIEVEGYAVVPGALDTATTGRLIANLDVGTHAIRNLFEAVPEIVSVARDHSVRTAVEAILGVDCFAVRGIFFDKTPGSNWKVAWHQDLTIAVRLRVEMAGFGSWSEKAGLPHVQPPAELLARMLTIRVQLDDCTEENGPLRVIPGSHRSGRLSPDEVSRRGWNDVSRTIVAMRGDLLVMRPLLLHASSAATHPGHRRVIHLEFAAENLPGGLEWHGRW